MTDSAAPARRPGPWDRPEGPAPPAPPPQSSPSRGSEIAWALISTALLAGWIWWQMGWVWALAGVVGVFVHEFGHVLAINALGCGPGRIHIVPFLGGAATSRVPPDTEFKGVLIALAGPVFGLVAMAPFFAAYAATGDQKWLGGAFFIAFLNLLNLAPAPPLDGSKAVGPALAWIHPMPERTALVLVGGGAMLWAASRGSWIFAVFVGLGVLGALQRGKLRPKAARLNRREWLLSLVLYVATLALCAAALASTLSGGAFERLLGAEEA